MKTMQKTIKSDLYGAQKTVWKMIKRQKTQKKKKELKPAQAYSYIVQEHEENSTSSRRSQQS